MIEIPEPIEPRVEVASNCAPTPFDRRAAFRRFTFLYRGTPVQRGGITVGQP
jgi:hypothetical protein